MWVLIPPPQQTNARLAKYAGLDAFQHTSNSGGTIQKALDFAINTDPGKEAAAELYPNVAAVGAIYGDPNGKYAGFLAKAEEDYPAEPYFLWNQPLSDSGWVSRNPNYGGTTSSNGNNANGSNGNGSGSSGPKDDNGNAKVVAGTVSLAVLPFLAVWLVA